MVRPRPGRRAGAALRLRRDLGTQLRRGVLAASCSTGSTSSRRGCAAVTTTGGDRMDLNRLTQKSQEALHDAQTKALRSGTPRSTSSTCCSRCSTSPTAWCRACSQRPASMPTRCAPRLEAELERRPRVSGPGRRPGRSRHAARSAGCSTPPRARPSGSRTSTSRSSTCCSRCSTRARRPRPAACCAEHGVTRERFLEALTAGARQPARDQRQARGHLRGAREVRPRPGRPGARRQARPGDRPRRRDPPRRSASSRARPRTTRC